MRRIVVILLLTAAPLCACSNAGSGSSTPTTAKPGSLNVTPCNYAQAWHDDPTQFSEFETLASFGRKATDSGIRSEAQQLTSAVASHDTTAVGREMGDIFATCRQLGLVRTTSASPQTTG
jgi:hypothetical protein